MAIVMIVISQIASVLQRYKATLSLSLPATFTRNDENMTLLKELLSVICENYTVTLIAPPPLNSSEDSIDIPKGASDHPAIDPAGSGVETVAALSQSLSDIQSFDARRVLEYSKEEGRLALARALSCDAHCEVLLETLKDGQSPHKRRAGQRLEEADGDITPRAHSPHRPNGQSTVDINEEVSLLEQYHADMARIRKSSSLLVFLVLPLKTTPQEEEQRISTSKTSISDIEVETVIQPFLLPGQEELSSRVPGVKIVDARAAEPDIRKAWIKAAHRITALSKGWQ